MKKQKRVESNLCQKYQFPWKILKNKKTKMSGIESMSKISIPMENIKNGKTKRKYIKHTTNSRYFQYLRVF